MALHLVTHMNCGGVVGFVDTEAPLHSYIITPSGRMSGYSSAQCMRCGAYGNALLGGNMLRDLSPYPALKAHALLARLRCSTG